MLEFCGTEFWNTQLVWQSSPPDFTACFEKTIILLIPCLYLWIFSFIEIQRLKKRRDRFIPWSWLNVNKLVVSGVILLTELSLLVANIILGSKEEGTVFGVDYFYPTILGVSVGFQSLLLLSHRRNGVQASGFLFGFWLLVVVCGLPAFRSNILYARDELSSSTESSIKVEFITYMIFYPCVLIMFILNCFADKPPKLEYYPRGKNACPVLNASFLNQITFSWLDGLVWKGAKSPLTQDDLFDLPTSFTSKVVVRKWDKNWTKLFDKFKRREEDPKSKSKKKSFSLLPVLLKTFQYELIVGIILKLIPDILTFVSPQLIKYLIGYSENLSIAEWKGYFYAVLLFIVTEITSVLNAQQFIVMYNVGIKIRTALTSAVYRKALKISTSSKKESTVGEIVNLMSIDVQRFLDLMGYINAIWSAPLQIILCIYFLWRNLGPSAMVGLLVMVILVPINGVIVNRQKVFQVAQMKKKDKRVKIVNEVLNGIKVLKLYAWEPSFIEQIMEIRKKEIKVLKSTSYLGSATTFLFNCTPFLVSFFMFMTYVLVSSDHVLTPDIVFVCITLLNILRMPMIILPIVIISMVQASVSLNRLNKFMNSEELNPNAVLKDPQEADSIVIENGTFSWGHGEDDTPTLQEINIRVKDASLVGVVGTVGAGKSSLCSAILGEMEKDHGRVVVNKSVAFVPQQAWIQNATLRDNILFGKPFDPVFYDRVIEACSLKLDLQILSDGDQTEIGEKGINLSGGQKQRVSLARAVYSEADIFILDDPLSAVDSHVGKDIFKHVIGPQGILKDKTRILVTHGLGYLHLMDEIVVLKGGRVSEKGSFSQLVNEEGDFREFLLQYFTATEEQDEQLEPEVLEEIKSELEKNPTTKEFGRQVSQLSNSSEAKRIKSKRTEAPRQGSESSIKSLTVKKIENKTSTKGKIIQEETMEVGRTSTSVYLFYARAIGMVASVLTVLFYGLSQLFAVLGNILLSNWSDDENGAVPETRNKYLGIYACYGIAQSVSILLGYLILARSSILGSQTLHNTMLNNVLRSPMSFFDMTPIGRIVNRFSKDVDITDVLLPMNLRSFLLCLMGVIATFGAIIYATPLFAVVMVPSVVVYFFIQNIYVKTSRQLKRIESVTRSPIYTHFGESIQGAATIRAYNKQLQFVKHSELGVDKNQLSYFPSIVCYRWLGIRLELIGNLLTFFAALFTVLNRGNVSGGDVGLSISYALSVTQILNFLVRLTSDVETNIVSVERLKEYCETPQEAPWDKPSNKPPKAWPEKGVVEFKDYSTRYREGLDLVVKNINCRIDPEEKIGIVGRTGAGKSSLTLALFRIIEPAGGTIVIDGVDIKTLGLHDLRKKLTIIPQDPVLFSGTLRMNLDPFDEHSDDAVWNALDHSHLRDFVSGLPSKLGYEVSEGGENLSVGQRQLLCLARALLRKSRVLVLDEATAAVDLETDDLIQATIRKEFHHCTVITIAHRLNTIMDATRIIVLDQGEIKEFDSPKILLRNADSLFYDMAKSAGLVRKDEDSTTEHLSNEKPKSD